MSRSPAPVRFLQRILLPGLGLAVILLAVLLSGARLLLPVFEADVRHWIERIAQDHGVELDAGRLELDWQGMGPRLSLTDATLHGQGGTTPLRLRRLSLTLDLPRSLLGARLHFGALDVEGASLQLVRDGEGRWQLQGLASSAARNSTAEAAWPAWMGMARRVHLVGSHLDLRDERSGLDLSIEDIEALFEEGLTGQRMALRMDLPRQLGGRIELRARLAGSLAELSQPTGEVWLSTSGLDMAGWSALLASLSLDAAALPVAFDELPRFEKGEVRGQAWLTLRDGALIDTQARLELADWRINPLQALRAGEREVALHSRLDLRLRHAGEDWNLDLAATPSDPRQPPQRFSLRRTQDQLAMAGEHFDLDLLRPWLVVTPILPESLRHALILHRPVGQLNTLNLHMRLAGEGSNGLPELQGHARFEAIGWRGEGYLPDVAALRGEAWLAGTAALLRLDSPGLRADFHGKFREPMAFDQARGDLALFWADTPRLVGRGLSLANRDLALQAELQLDLPQDGAPLIALEGRFQRARAERVPAYLPVDELGEEALAWLDRALPQSGGFVPQGALHLHGDLSRFPYYAEGGGQFEVRFAFQDLRLDYAPGWRPAERLHGELAFVNNGLEGRIDGGSLRGVPLREGWLAIPDFDRPRLDLRLVFAGKVESMLETLKDSPLIKERAAFDDATLTGPAALHLGIEVRLDSADPRPDQAEGWIDLHGARLAAFDQVFEALQGRLHFLDDRLDAHDIRARYRGREARLGVESEPRGTAYAYRISLDTLTEAGDWLEAGSPWSSRLKGAFPLHAELLLDAKGPRGRPVDLELRSELEGLTIDLPLPFGKSADARHPTEARLTWRDGVLDRLQLRQPGQLAARLELTDSRVRAGHIQLGEGEAETPIGEGRLLIEANLPAFDLGAWQAALDTPPGDAQTLPARIDLRARLGRLEAFGSTWEAMQVDGQRDPTGWRLRLESPRLAGLARAPARPTPAEPLSLDLVRLVLNANEAPRTDATATRPPPSDPDTLPPLRISIAELSFGELRLKDIRLRTLPQPRGLLLQELRADTGHLTIRGEGSWMLDDKNRHQTNLTLNLASEDVGAALDELGFRNTLRRGRLEDTQLRLRWADAPDRFAWAILEGGARLNVRDGALESVEPGAGRVLGLLSVTELPRRLLLDFGDVFGEGLRFDRIASTLSFREGRAITELMQLNGPSAQIFMKGYSDMLSRTLHYDMVVVPALGNVLPIIGTVAGGPLVGGAVFLLQKVFDQLGGERSGFNYRVSGSWDEPRVERVEAGS
ncbi:YhdP family protein [Thiofaba sp. EF100]|uniref:YhdP family protein n=1 Tax=Thiofaba sp. EF100 TaxID=3121274 RepID=UPI00322168D9